MSNQTRSTWTAPLHEQGEAAHYAAGYEGWSRVARYYHSRFYSVAEQLRTVPGGHLLDLGCGPGMMVRHLVDTRPADFTITAVDHSPAMLSEAAARLSDVADVRLEVARAEDLPLSDASVDVALAMGVLEYTDLPVALREIARVTRSGGLVLVTMLNPRNPYRLFEWGVYLPFQRALGRLARLVGVPADRRYSTDKQDIRAYTRPQLQRMLRAAGLEPQDVVYYDLTPTVPPLDRLARRVDRGWRDHPEATVTRGAGRWMGTAYLVAARRT